ncbi:MAG: hypothetical protein ABI679_00600 [Gemmatimonadota bacterium]
MTIHVPVGRPERIAMETRRAEAIEEGYRAHRRFLFRIGLIYCGWLAIGCFLMMASFHVATYKYASLLYEMSFLIGYGGMFFTAVFAYVRGRERGDW